MLDKTLEHFQITHKLRWHDKGKGEKDEKDAFEICIFNAVENRQNGGSQIKIIVGREQSLKGSNAECNHKRKIVLQEEWKIE